VFLDCMTFRAGLYSSHFGEVRPGIEGDLAEWEKRDPLKRMGDWLIEHDLISAAGLEQLRQEEEQRIEDAFKRVTAELSEI